MTEYEFNTCMTICDKLQPIFPDKGITIEKQIFSRMLDNKQLKTFEYQLYIEDIGFFKSSSFGGLLIEVSSLLSKYEREYAIRLNLANHDWDKYFAEEN